MRFRWIIAVLGLALVTACAGPRDVEVRRDAWTGADIVTSQEREIYRDGDGIMTVRPVIIARDGNIAHGVMTNVRRRDANGPKIERMTAFGRDLPYRRLDRLRTHCSQGCQKAEVGFIGMSAESFSIAARTGLPLRVWGQRGRYEGTVPADAFAAVLAQWHE